MFLFCRKVKIPFEERQSQILSKSNRFKIELKHFAIWTLDYAISTMNFSFSEGFVHRNRIILFNEGRAKKKLQVCVLWNLTKFFHWIASLKGGFNFKYGIAANGTVISLLFFLFLSKRKKFQENTLNHLMHIFKMHLPENVFLKNLKGFFCFCFCFFIN